MQVVHSNVAFVQASSDVRAAVTLMKERKISSLLVVNASEQVCGILTERDIVHKFTLLAAAEQAACKVEGLMSQPVHFARQDHLIDDVITLHFAHRIRHFPVVRDADQRSRQTVVGMVSITDVARNYLHGLSRKAIEPKLAGEKVVLLVAACDDAAFDSYRGIFSALGYEVQRLDAPAAVATTAKAAGKNAVLVDMDGYPLPQLEPILAAVKATKLPAIFATSRVELLAPFKKGLAGTRRDVALKPIDVSHCHWSLINWLR